MKIFSAPKRLLTLLSLFLLALVSGQTALAAPSPHVVISQIYGGGGNSGATWRYDFVEPMFGEYVRRLDEGLIAAGTVPTR